MLLEREHTLMPLWLIFKAAGVARMIVYTIYSITAITFKLDCHWALSTRYLSDVSISLLPDDLFLLTMVITGGRYIIYAGGSLTKVSVYIVSLYYLRTSDPLIQIRISEKGIFSIHPSLTVLYCRLQLGARIGKDVLIHDRTRLYEWPNNPSRRLPPGYSFTNCSI